jgi:transcriptional regulator with XRE-family HTH domain
MSRNLTMVELARTLGISKQSIHQWETMRTIPSADSLIELADALVCSLDYLAGRSDEPGYGTNTTPY